MLPHVLMFFVGFCLMAVEVVAGRLVAPYLGVSVYTWTSVIGAVLLGMIIGNILGGILADRRSGKAFLGASFAAAGVSVLLVHYLALVIGTNFDAVSAPLWFKSIVFSLLCFFPVACMLSGLGPQLTKMAMHNTEKAGRVFGNLGAWNAVGSILGTSLAGFVFIEWIGTRSLLALIALALCLVGCAIAWPVPIWKNRLALATSLFFIGDLFMPPMCAKETQYYCIRVDRRDAEQGVSSSYILRLDHLIHSYVYPTNPERVGYGYEQVYTNLIGMRYADTDQFSTMFIGGGGYSLPRYLEHFYPNADVRVIEIDPGVTAANHSLLELSPTTAIVSVNVDARRYITENDSKADLVFGDAFNDFSVPYHLTTVEFHRLLKSRMNDDGVYALNIIDDARYGMFLASMVRTLQSVWSNVYVAPQASEILPGRNTIVLLASDVPIDETAWYADRTGRPFTLNSSSPEDRAKTLHLISADTMRGFLDAHPARALTDDFAPTERYLAPVFRDAY